MFRLTTLKWLLSAALFNSALAAADKPVQEVQDLRYGVVLYHFFQQQYFDAITESLVGEARQDLPFHYQSDKLLRGGMSLSFGMGDQAEAIFTELLKNLQGEARRNRAWFYLGKLYYLRGDYAQAQSVFANIRGELEKPLQQQYLYYSARLLLNQQDVASAEANINQLPQRSPWRGYYHLNRGSSLAVQGQVEEAIANYERVIGLDIASEEITTLKDKAHIAAGFTQLANSEFDEAIQHFLKVRLESPLVNRALLGYGWAASQQEDFELALSPWHALSQGSVMDASVQESLLAVPYAYEKLNAKASALEQYLKAIGVYQSELTMLDQSLAVYNTLPLVQVIADEDSLGGDWITGADYLPLNEQAPYLLHLVAQDSFQLAVKNLSDLLRMQSYLQDVEQRLQTMALMLDDKQQLWEQDLNSAQRDQYRQQYQQLQSLRSSLQQQRQQVDADKDSRGYANPAERERWQVLDRARQRIDALQKAGEDMSAEQQQLQRFEGLLIWQANEVHSERRWQYQKQAKKIDQNLLEIDQRLLRIESLSSNRLDRAFRNRLQALQQRLQTQQQQIQLAVDNSESEIRQLAIAELNQQKRRLTDYLSRARLAVARLYDEGSEESSQ